MPHAFPAAAAPVHYRIDPSALHERLYRVTLTIQEPAAAQELSLPVWIPGSYLVREFSKNLQRLKAHQGGQPVALAQLDKCRWRAECAPQQPLTLEYEVAAYDNSVRTAWLDPARGFFNGTSLCLRVHGREHEPHDIEVLQPPTRPDWRLATGLDALHTDGAGFGSYRAHDYDELVDGPVEMGAFWSAEFSAAGVPHRLVVAGAAPSFDGARLVQDVQRLCEETIALWHGPGGRPPFGRYVFLLNAVGDGYGGLEHRNSTALICSRRDLPRRGEAKPGEGYQTLLGLFAHEYFHAWCVKRLRPAELERYDYGRENYTQLLWFFEGFTSYYDDLLLRRAGLVDHASYLRVLTKSINQVLQTPGRQVQSVAEASFDAWVKFYRQDENTPNSTVSYYSKGALVGLCLDLALRREGKTNLDEVLRAVWQRTGGGPLSEEQLRAVLQELSGRDWAPELDAWVHGTGELPLAELLEAHGIALRPQASQLAQRLGLRVAEAEGSMRVKVVLRGGAAEQAGFMAGDEWLAVETPEGGAWRLQRLDELPLYAGGAQQLTAWVARDQRVLRLALALPDGEATGDTVSLEVSDAQAATAWLGAA